MLGPHLIWPARGSGPQPTFPPPSCALIALRILFEAAWMCRETLGFWLLTSPFCTCWAPVACRREPITAGAKPAGRSLYPQWPGSPGSTASGLVTDGKPEGAQYKVSQVASAAEPRPSLFPQPSSSNILPLPGSQSTPQPNCPCNASVPL